MASWADVFTVSAKVTHSLRTITVREALIGVIVRGSKRIVASREVSGVSHYATGSVCLLPHGSTLDVINSVGLDGRYEARVLTLKPGLLALFVAQYPIQTSGPSIESHAKTIADDVFTDAFSRAFDAMRAAESSDAIQRHRVLELLLVLAERGLVFSAVEPSSWSDRVRRVVAQRPHAVWSVNALARVFHVSESTLRKNLALEGNTVTGCLREVRLETGLALLQTTQLQVSEVAGRCGYESHSRFSAAFRDRYGFAPSHLRR
jgi:AraC-like DNA-binding protein